MLFLDSEAITTVVSVGDEKSTRYLVLMMTARGYESVMCVFYEKKCQETLYNSKLAPCIETRRAIFQFKNPLPAGPFLFIRARSPALSFLILLFADSSFNSFTAAIHKLTGCNSTDSTSETPWNCFVISSLYHCSNFHFKKSFAGFFTAISIGCNKSVVFGGSRHT